jgi:hypothetical protein
MARAPERQPGPGNLAFDAAARPVLTVEPGRDEYGEVLGIVRQWPLADRLELLEALGLTIGGGQGYVQSAFDSGREVGKAEGHRELLQRLFCNVKTGKELIERAATMAFVEVWPDNAPCPLKPTDFASLAGVSERTAARRAAEAKMAVSFPNEQRAKPLSVAVAP